MSVTILVFFTNAVNAEPYQSNVITVGPKNLPPEIKDMFTCYSAPVPIKPTVDPMGGYSTYQLNQKGIQFVFDNNRDLNNNTSLGQLKTLNMFFTTVEKKLVAESLEFKSLQGDNKSIVFDIPDGGAGLGGCEGFGTTGTFKTQSNEKYGIIFQMNDGAYSYSLVFYPYLDTPIGGKIPVKYLIITEVELNSDNGTQWIRIYNPTKYDIPLHSAYINGEGPTYQDPGYIEAVSWHNNSTLRSGHDLIVQIHSSSTLDHMPIRKALLTIYPMQVIIFTNNDYKSPWHWDRTPIFADTYHDSRTWQYNGTGWVFTDKRVAIPEFPLAIPILTISLISLLVFYRMKSKIEI
jgi:hypothetical protein